MTENHTNGNGFNGFSSKEMLVSLNNRVEAMDAKLDQKVGDHERRIIILEIETLKRGGQLEEEVSSISSRVNSLENDVAIHHQTDEVIKNSKNHRFNKQNVMIASAGTIFVIVQGILAFVAMTH